MLLILFFVSFNYMTLFALFVWSIYNYNCALFRDPVACTATAECGGKQQHGAP